MNGENKVSGVGLKQTPVAPGAANGLEPRLSGTIASQLSATADERAKAIEDARPKVETPKPEANIAAAAEALANEPVEKPKSAVFDSNSAAAKAERNKKSRKTLIKILLILLVLALLGGAIYLIIRAVGTASFADTKSRTNAVYSAVENLTSTDENSSCYVVETNYQKTTMGAETFAAWVENCWADINVMREAVKLADEDAGIKKDETLATRWSSFKITYDALADEMEKALVFYEAAHAFILAAEESDFRNNAEAALEGVAEAVAKFKDSDDEIMVTLGEELAAKVKTEAESHKAVAEIEKTLVEKYSNIEAAEKDPSYADYAQKLADYMKAQEEYSSVAESVYKGGVGVLEDLTGLKETLYDQAGALKAGANKY